MALRVLAFQSCAKYLGERGLKISMAFEADGGHRNSLWRQTRFEKILISNLSKLCFRSKHKYAEKLLEAINKYDATSTTDRSNLLNKVYVLMECDGLRDVSENKAAREEFGRNLEDAINDFDIILACKDFPSITLGNGSSIQLYDDSSGDYQLRSLYDVNDHEKFFPHTADVDWVASSESSEVWTSLYPAVSSIVSSESKEGSYENFPIRPQSDGKKSPVESDCWVPAEESSSQMDGDSAKPVEVVLDKAIRCIAGLNKRNIAQLEECGFFTLRKLLHHFPRSYADAQNAHLGIVDGQYLIFIGRILSSKGVRASYSFSFLEVVVGGDIVHQNLCSESKIEGVEDHGRKRIYVHLKKFFRGVRFTSQPFLRSLQHKYKEGDLVCVSGKVKSMSIEDHYEMREYCLDIIEDDSISSACVESKPYPIYSSKGGLKPDFFRDMIQRALKTLPRHVDPIPIDITSDLGLLHLHDAYNAIHLPKDINQADMARKRFVFDEFFYLQLARLYQMLESLGTWIEREELLEKYRNPTSNAAFTEEWSFLARQFLQSLPYKLTPGQLNSVSEIIWDLKRPVPMNRLLQGDVGCGKTIVSFLACMEVIGSGFQAAFMVPTELLAIQHYEHLNSLLNSVKSDHKPSISLLTGSTPARQARLILQGLKSGEISLVIGTHSLIAERVEFSMLRLAIIDEQHRFGVIQRGLFNSKLYNTSIRVEGESAVASDTSMNSVSMAPHVLAMTATPIPRTLALALYGDMSLTQITDLPPGRIPVDTYIMEGSEAGFEKVYQMMESELESGGRIYLVYPIIEISEQLPQLRAASADLDTISSRFPDYSCSLLHGKMKGEVKDEVLRGFRLGETHILLATQVIEIGVDVPDASMMVVMNAERFGIAQLHQLRGRVGRGDRKSKCVLLASTETSLARLKVLEHSSDGFHLANVDLLLRGPGDLLGKKQSGHLPEFPVTRLEIDGNLLQEAHDAALKVLSRSHDLERFRELKAELSMRRPLSILGD